MIALASWWKKVKQILYIRQARAIQPAAVLEDGGSTRSPEGVYTATGQAIPRSARHCVQEKRSLTCERTYIT
jgi:hypothetical protein